MLKNRDEVLKLRDCWRESAGDYFIPLGGRDTATESKKDISNLTATLYNHLPVVKAIVDTAKAENIPVYVGYDGQYAGTRNGTYTSNLILLHEEADESTLAFIHAYSHELVHLDQDRRGLLRESAPVPASSEMVNYLAHNLMLEAAAFATEAVSLYYISERSTLCEKDDEVQDYFDEYAANLPSNIFMRDLIEESLAGKRGNDFLSLKPAWQAAFQAFFDPDSEHVKNYLKQFSQVYLKHSLDGNTEHKTQNSAGKWGGVDELKSITTMTGWGQMFPASSLPILLRSIRASIIQERNLPMIDVVRSHVAAQEQFEEKKADVVLSFLKNLAP
jgi:hypothetical protein